MKHNYTAWRFLDPQLDTKGGAILEAIEKNHKATTEQKEQAAQFSTQFRKIIRQQLTKSTR
jgi:hypothetical protein